MSNDFSAMVADWMTAACRAWDFPVPNEQQVQNVENRLPEETRDAIANGIQSGEVLVDGFKFRLRSIASEKGPYSWFSRYVSKQQAGPNWEYFVQVAEYLRLRDVIPAGYRINFEDALMDITAWNGIDLVMCCEVKEKASQLGPLLRGIERHSKGIDINLPDRHADDLRKAKYIASHRPHYFSLVAIGERMEFEVMQTDDLSFGLKPTQIDWGSLDA